MKDITDNKKFWKTVKPFLSDKSKTSDKIHLNENGELLNSESETAEVLNNFLNIVKNLKIPEYENLDRNFENVEDPVLRAILKYKNHPSITVIKEKAKNSVFSFYEVDKDKIKKEINRLNKNKASQKSDIPIKIIHDNVDIFADFIAESFKGAIKTSNFSNCLKLADITPLHKKGRKDNKENYRPVSILPTLSKIFEKILFEQISVFFDKFFIRPTIWVPKRIIYNDKQSSFNELLNKDSSVSIHIRNIQRLAIEMFKFYNCLSPPLMNNIFKLREENPYNLRHVSEFSRPMINSVYHGTESISFLGPKIWDILPEKLKNIETLEVFKKEIKIWKPDNCPCRLCKVFIEGVGFL